MNRGRKNRNRRRRLRPKYRFVLAPFYDSVLEQHRLFTKRIERYMWEAVGLHKLVDIMLDREAL